MSISFKTNKERDQYVELGTKNPALVELLIDLEAYIRVNLKKNIVITSVYRSPEEQAALYKQSTHKVKNSDHTLYQAVDLRSWLYSPAEIEQICTYLNKKYKNASGAKVAMCHAITGGAMHFHIALQRAKN